MKKKTEPELWRNSMILARIGFISFLFLVVQWQSIAAQGVPVPQDSVSTGMDSLDFVYHKAWSFEAGYEDAYLSQEEYIYEEIEQEKNWLQRAKLWLNNKWISFLEQIWGGAELSKFWQVLLQLAPYLFLLALMGLLVWLSLKYSSGASADDGIRISPLSADEVLLKSDNLKALSEEALESQDFRLALRYRYLLVLQHLIERKLIIWKSSKTNFDYQKELAESPFRAPFTEVTRIYNFVWYGHFDLDAKAYGELEQAFNHLDQLP